MDFESEWQQSGPPAATKKDHSQMGDISAAFLAAETGRPAPPPIPTAKVSNSTDDFEHITHDDDGGDDFNPLSEKKISAPIPPPAAAVHHFDDDRETPSPKLFCDSVETTRVADEPKPLLSSDLLDLDSDFAAAPSAVKPPIFDHDFDNFATNVLEPVTTSAKFDAPSSFKEPEHFAPSKTPEPELLVLSRTPEPEFEESSETPEPDFFAPSKTPEPERPLTPEPPKVVKVAAEPIIKPEPVKVPEVIPAPVVRAPEPQKPAAVPAAAAAAASSSSLKSTAKKEPMIAVEEIFYKLGLGM